MSELHLLAPDGVGEVRRGDDLVTLATEHLELRDGDVLVVTSKVVAKAEGRVRYGERAALVGEETVRVVARRGPTMIVVNRQGLVQAAAGIDASNTEPGTVVLLPEDPDASARRIREALAEVANVAVVVTDTAGRAWRHGQTDLAVGCAGLDPMDDHAGRRDAYGNELAVTAPAIADEVAAAAELATGKLGRRPLCRVRGLAERVLPAGEHGPGARALQRQPAEDMFTLGTREAVLTALAGRDPDLYGRPVARDEVTAALADLGVPSEPHGDGGLVVGDGALARVAAHALGWAASAAPEGLVLTPRTS